MGRPVIDSKTYKKLQATVVKMIGAAKWAGWCSDISFWWEEEYEAITPEEIQEALVRIYGKKTAKVFNKLSPKAQLEKLIEGECTWVLREFVYKLYQYIRGATKLSSNLELEIHDYSIATVEHEGTVESYKIPGLVCITGSVTVDGNLGVNVFSKWVSHPFWQYAARG